MTLAALLGTTATIRPSALPGFNDCARRTAADLFPGLIQAAGFTLRRLDHGVGASVGTAVHKAAHYTLATKIEDGSLGNVVEADQRAMEAFHNDIAEGVVWDPTTRERATGEKQIIRMVKCYRDKLAPAIDAVAVEERLEADLGETGGVKFVVAGTKDVLCREPKGIRDLKTGRAKRANGAQYGAYALIDRSHDRALGIETLTEDYIRRGSLKNPQPDPEMIAYDVAACENAALDTIEAIKTALEEFARRLAVGDRPPEGAFPANPQSMLCSSKYCRAHSTPFCRLHRSEA